MDTQKMSESWQERSQEISIQVAAWRRDHPTATLAEIEQTVDEQLSSLWSQMIQEAAHASRASEGETLVEEPTDCPECGKRMQARGRHARHLQAQGGREVILNRRYLTCPHCGYSFFSSG